MAANEKLAKQLKLIIGNILENQIDGIVERTAITIEEYARVQIAQGVDPAEVRARLVADLKEQNPRFFGGLRTELKTAVYGAENLARSAGQKVALEEMGEPERLYRWQTNGINICEDCLERHGQVDTLQNWESRGMPAAFGSRCGENCLCTLVPEDMIFDPIKVGQA